MSGVKHPQSPTIKKYTPGLALTVLLALAANLVSGFVPYHLISGYRTRYLW